MKIKLFSRVFLLTFLLVLATMLSLLYMQPNSLAQSDLMIDKTLNNPDNTVRVGDDISFTIRVDNQSVFTLTQVRLEDTFDNNILQFTEAAPVQDDVTGGTIVWNNIAASTNPAGMAPNDVLTLTVSFRAIRPETAIVNRVEGKDVIREGGQNGSGAEDQDENDGVVRGIALLKKERASAEITPQIGLPVTFTHIITNDSGAQLAQLPLTDTYDADFLTFNFGVPEPDVITPPGTLVWTNLATDTYFGPLEPDASIVITTVFTAVGEVTTTLNQAVIGRAVDEFGNDAAGAADEAPITVIDSQPTPTPDTPSTPDDDDDDDDDGDDDSPTSPPPAASIPATPLPSTPTQPAAAASEQPETPLHLPETGQRYWSSYTLFLGGIILLGIGWFLLNLKR